MGKMERKRGLTIKNINIIVFNNITHLGGVR
jgi:hypothetical protein